MGEQPRCGSPGPCECFLIASSRVWWTARIRAAKQAWQGRGRKGVRLWPSEVGSLFLTRSRISCTLSCHGGWYERTAALLVQHMCAGFSFFAEVATVRRSRYVGLDQYDLPALHAVCG